MTLHDALRQRGAPLRSAAALARVLPTVAGQVVVLGLAAWLIRLGWGGAPLWVLVAWGIVLLALAGLAVRLRRALAGLSPAAVARRLEAAGGWRRGALTTLLAPTARGTSAALHHHAEEAEARRVLERGGPALAPELDSLRASGRRWLAMIAVGAVALAGARPLDGSAMLFRPWLAWSALTAPIGLATDTPVVERGERARLLVAAFGQREAILSLRAPGEPWRDQVVPLDGSGRAVVETAPLDAELVARVRVGARRSDELRIAIRLPAFLGAFSVTAHYPGYLALEDEAVPIDGDTLVLPEGTRLAIAGRATTDLARVWMSWPGDSVVLPVDGDGFAGELRPRVTGTYRLGAEPRIGGRLEGILPALVVRVVPDSAPRVTIPVPGVDTMAPPSHRLAVVVAIEDDHAIVAAALEWRRGGAGTPERRPLPLAPGTADRALLSTALDLDSLGLGPGDTLRYRAVARDNAPAARLGRSSEFLVVVPTAAEERAARGDATREAGRGLDSLAAQARQAQRQADELARERPRGEAQAGSDPEHPDPLSADAARRAEQAIEAEESVERQLDQMQQRLEELQRAAERGERPDTALARELGEIRRLLEEALTPELRAAMERLREGLKKLDASETREALGDLAERQEKMRAAIERARELFERAKSETELATLAEEARELLAEQEAATAALAADSAAAAAREDQLAARSDSLAAALDDAAERAPAEPTREGLESAADQARAAAREMRAAAGSARRGQRQQAQRQAKAAGEALKPLETDIRRQREEMQEEMRREVLGALDRLLLETSRTLDQQHRVAEALRRGALAGRLRSEQSMLEEGTAKLLQQVIAVAGKHALISPTIAVALAGARDGMRQSIEATSAASPSLALAADRAGEAVDMLAVAAYALLRSQQAVAESESGSGLEEAMQMMQQMAGQQGQLSDQGKSMLQQGDPGMAEMLQMAIDQRAIAQQLERLRAGGELPGAGELAQDAQDLARSFELGRLTPETIERQQRLFRRMLDAGRSLRGDEEDERKERQSARAGDAAPARPEALDPALLRGAEFELPSWEALQRLSPDDRRRVMDYFRRLAERRP